jgi:integrase
LSLQWHQIMWDENVIMLPAEKTKTHQSRSIPMTARLRSVLEMRRCDPLGNKLGPDCYVFGTETGEMSKSVKTAWENTRKRAGITGLHFHDLRREAASRLMESPGVALHEVGIWLGHNNIATTSKYLATTGIRKQATMHRFEASRHAVDIPAMQNSVRQSEAAVRGDGGKLDDPQHAQAAAE